MSATPTRYTETQREPSEIRPSPGESEVYSVTQLNLAAYLVVAGHRLLRVEPMENGRRFCQFIFERDKQIALDRMGYYEYNKHVDARTFAEELVKLKGRAIETLEENKRNGDKNL
jgi:hypothetical protein